MKDINERRWSRSERESLGKLGNKWKWGGGERDKKRKWIGNENKVIGEKNGLIGFV